MNTVRWIVVCFIGFCLVGCGGGGGGGPTVVVKVAPVTQGILINGSQQFTATATNTTSTATTWTVQEGVVGGAVSALGVYHAPATAGTYHVVATISGVSGTATVTVHPIVTVLPASPTVLAGAGHTQTFTATVTGSSNQNVTWSVGETGGGTISGAGVYSPPNTPGAYQVVATSVADTAATGFTTVTVQGGNIQGTIQ